MEEKEIILDKKTLEKIEKAIEIYQLKKSYNKDKATFHKYYQQVKKCFPEKPLEHYWKFLLALKICRREEEILPLDQTFRTLCANFKGKDKEKNIEYAELFLTLYPDIVDSVSEKTGDSALTRAVKANDPDTVEFLFFHGANTESAYKFLNKDSDARIRFMLGRDNNYRSKKLPLNEIHTLLRLSEKGSEIWRIKFNEHVHNLASLIKDCPDIYNIKLHLVDKIKEIFESDFQEILNGIFVWNILKEDGSALNYCRAKYLLKLGADINPLQRKGDIHLIHTVASLWQVENLLFLLKNNANISQITSEGYTALECAIATDENNVSKKTMDDFREIISLLTGAGISLYKNELTQFPPLFRVTEKDCPERLEVLHEYFKIDLNAQDKDGANIFHYIALNNAIKTAQYFNQKMNKETALSEQLKKLINANFGYLIKTPLSIAVQRNHDKIVDVFLKTGADPNVPVYYEMPEKQIKVFALPLDIAIQMEYQSIQKSLIPVTSLDNLCKENILKNMILMNSSLENIRLFLEKHKNNININYTHKEQEGKTALIFAIEAARLDVVSFLVQLEHIELNIQDKNGMTALHYAVKLGLPFLVRNFLEKGANFGVAGNKEEISKEIIRIAALLKRDDILYNFRDERIELKKKEARQASELRKEKLIHGVQQPKDWSDNNASSTKSKKRRTRKNKNPQNAEILKTVGTFSEEKSKKEEKNAKQYNYTFGGGLFRLEDVVPLEVNDTQKNLNYFIYQPKTEGGIKQLARNLVGYTKDKEEIIMRLLNLPKRFCRESNQQGIARNHDGTYKLKGIGHLPYLYLLLL